MTGWRVAVHPGATTVRLAGYQPDGPSQGGPRLLAEAPAGVAPAELVAELVSGTPIELLVVHPTGCRPEPVGAPPYPVRPVSVAAAAAAGTRGSLVVVDAGHTDSEVVLLRPGTPPVVRRIAVGGARLDQVTRSLLDDRVTLKQARRVREALSLLPEVVVTEPHGGGRRRLRATTLRSALALELQPIVTEVQQMLATNGRVQPPPPVRLIGGLARTPLLAELLDAAGIAAVEVAQRPEAAAVLGALRLPPAAPEHPVPASPPAVPHLPPTRSGRGVRIAVGSVCVTGLAITMLAARPVDPAVTPPSDQLVQYGYAAAVPPGWAHTGGLPERRRSLLTPVDAPRGADVIAIEQTPLGYDSDAEPQQARAELRARYDAAVAAGEPLGDFDPDTEFAGRRVVTYRQTGDYPVEWYVVFDGDSQLSVGCRATSARREAVTRACATVVASVRRTH